MVAILALPGETENTQRRNYQTIKQAESSKLPLVYPYSLCHMPHISGRSTTNTLPDSAQ